jgi:hypothetical protein
MPITCSLSRGFINPCLDGVGGAKQIFIANWSTFANQITLNSSREITNLPTATLYRIEGLRNSISVTDSPTPNVENNTLFFTQTVTVKLGKMELEKHNEVLGVYARARMIIFVQLESDEIICIGRESGCFLTAGSAGSGLAKGDLNGYELTFTAEEPVQAPYCQAFTTEPFDNYADITVTPDFNATS